MHIAERLSSAIVLTVLAAYGIWAFIVPWFGGVPSAPAGGEPVSTYEYDGRPAVRHAGGVQWYVVDYDLTPEMVALLADLSLFGIYLMVSVLLRRRRLKPAPPELARAAR